MFDLFLSALSAINIFEEYMLSLRRNKKFRKNLSSALKIPFDNLTQSYDNMIESFYQLMGALIAGSYVRPVDYQKSAKKLADNFLASYKKFDEDLDNFIFHVKMHTSSLMVVMGPRPGEEL